MAFAISERPARPEGQPILPNRVLLPADRQSLINLIGCVFTEMFSQQVTENPTKFQCCTMPSITLLEYLQRLATYIPFSDQTLVMAAYNILKIHQQEQSRCSPLIVINALNIHRLFLASLVTTAKYQDDFQWTNAFYAQCGGISTLEMNSLEFEFLTLIKYSFFIKPPEYERFLNALRNPLIHAECTCRSPLSLEGEEKKTP